MGDGVIRVLLAEDMNLIRGALVALLEPEPDVEVVSAVSSGEAAVSEALRQRPDVAVLDINMPGDIDGLAAAAVLAERLPGCRVLILTSPAGPRPCAGPWRRTSWASCSRTPRPPSSRTRSGGWRAANG